MGKMDPELTADGEDGAAVGTVMACPHVHARRFDHELRADPDPCTWYGGMEFQASVTHHRRAAKRFKLKVDRKNSKSDVDDCIFNRYDRRAPNDLN